MKKQEKQEYETPQIEMINARIEKGFVGSLTSGGEAGDGLTEGDGYGDEIFG